MANKQTADKQDDGGSILAIARAYVTAGISLVPIRRDGTKAPAVDSWKVYQQRLPNDAELCRWFGGAKPGGIALLGGAVSGSLEQLDFDRDAQTVFPEWRRLVVEQCPGLAERLTIAATPARGYHVRYRCPNEKIPGNTDLALDPKVKGKGRVLIQTRGEGGYAIAPGSPAECHETGRPYLHQSGPFVPPSLTPDEREILWSCARSLSLDVAQPPRPVGADRKPGEDFDRRGPDWPAILEPHGWRSAGRTAGGEIRWCRPNKEKGWSATTGHCRGQDGADLLRVFSSNAAPFEDGNAYGKFRAFALLNHGGNLSAAAAELTRQGYGTRPAKARERNGQAASCRNGAAAKRPAALPSYQSFPLSALPPVLREYIDASAAAIGCDPALVALPALAVVAGCVGNSRTLRLRKGWAEPAIVWAVTIAPSGAHKSPAFAAAVDPLVAIQMDAVDARQAEQDSYAKELKVWRAEKRDERRPEDEPAEPPLARISHRG